jgi:hypothetical protein
MRKFFHSLCLSFLMGLSALVQGADSKPNFIFILADDMGWNDAGFCGNAFVETPCLNALAQSGVVFSKAYASAPNCAPTRACLLTGQYTPRHGVYTVVDDRHSPGSPHQKILAAESRAELPASAVTLPEALKSGGYATALFGMWNLGRGRSGNGSPTEQGFDLYVEPKDLGFEKDAYRRSDGAYTSDALTEGALKWIEARKSQPFFLYLAFHDVHAPYDPKPDLLAKYKARPDVPDPVLAASVEAMDANIGRLVAGLKRMGLTENTHIVFTSDNGGTRQYIAPLRGGKGTLYEGGLRVPAIFSGPGIRAGRVSETPIVTMDFYPTFLEIAGVPVSQKVDGASLVPLLRGETEGLSRDLFWHFPSYSGPTSPCSAMRSGNWKVIEFFETGMTEIYDLSRDVSEEKNLEAAQPERARELLAKLHQWHEDTGAPCPRTPNPNYDPHTERARNREGRGKSNKSSQ